MDPATYLMEMSQYLTRYKNEHGRFLYTIHYLGNVCFARSMIPRETLEQPVTLKYKGIDNPVSVNFAVYNTLAKDTNKTAQQRLVDEVLMKDEKDIFSSPSSILVQAF